MKKKNTNNTKNTKKYFKKDSYYCNKTNRYPISFAILGMRDSNSNLQSTLFHNPGGSPERDRQTDRQTQDR